MKGMVQVNANPLKFSPIQYKILLTWYRRIHSKHYKSAAYATENYLYVIQKKKKKTQMEML
jgi:hypothetical protein